MIEHTERDGIWKVCLNRPDKANALTTDMLQELSEIAEAAHADARVFVLTAKGKVFSAGADLEAARAGLATSPLWDRLSGAIAALPCLSIAALNGTLAGGAFGMALACDLRVAVPEAKFFYPVMKLGFLPQPSDPARLRALIGPSRAKMILMAGAKIEAPTALDWGLIDQIAPRDDLEDAVLALADHSLHASIDHARRIKALIA